ncbi:unnamed protein product [Rhodiola kirilowii]
MVLELAGSDARDDKKNRIVPRHIWLAVIYIYYQQRYVPNSSIHIYA